GMHCHGEAERRRIDLHLMPRLRPVDRPAHAVAVLRPEHVGRAGAADDPVRVLDHRIFCLLRRHVRREHPAGRDRPRLAAIVRLPSSTARDPDENTPRLARIDADRMDAGEIISAAEPLPAFRLVPERTQQPPRIAAVRRVEKPARNGSAPERLGLAWVRLEYPHLIEAPRHRRARGGAPIVDVAGLLRPLRRRHLLPGLALIHRSMQLGSEVTVPHRGVDGSVPLQYRGHCRAEKRDAGDLVAAQREEALAGADEQRIHVHPPESACITAISASGATASVSRTRSRTASPPTKTTTCRRNAPWSSTM